MRRGIEGVTVIGFVMLASACCDSPANDSENTTPVDVDKIWPTDVDLPKIPSPEPDPPIQATASCDTNVRVPGFELEVEWEYAGIPNEQGALAIPIVADLSGDGFPEVIVNLFARGDYFGFGHLHILDGRTGELMFRIEQAVGAGSTAAVGDIDGDGLPEIISFGRVEGLGDVSESFEAHPGVEGRLLAFEHDGTLKWHGDRFYFGGQSPIALADLDADGDVEIMVGGLVADHEGKTLFVEEAGNYSLQATTAADLDGDGISEVIRGFSASRLDGSIYFDHTDFNDKFHGPAEVADLDGDGLPEVLVHSVLGFAVIEHDGSLSRDVSVETYEESECFIDTMPGAIGDLDSDGRVEFLGNDTRELCLFNSEFELITRHSINEDRYAGITAFDFLGDGQAEIIQGDLSCLRIVDQSGELLWAAPRHNVTQSDFPVVVDVDGDGIAELLSINNAGYNSDHSGPGQYELPAIRVFGAEHLAKARKIWNQHAYHTTNVNDDATIPQFPHPNWQGHNSFRMMHSPEFSAP